MTKALFAIFFSCFVKSVACQELILGGRIGRVTSEYFGKNSTDYHSKKSHFISFSSFAAYRAVKWFSLQIELVGIGKGGSLVPRTISILSDEGTDDRYVTYIEMPLNAKLNISPEKELSINAYGGLVYGLELGNFIGYGDDPIFKSSELSYDFGIEFIRHFNEFGLIIDLRYEKGLSVITESGNWKTKQFIISTGLNVSFKL